MPAASVHPPLDLDEYVRRLVDAAPPLTRRQLHQIAAILRTDTRSEVAA